MEGEQFISCRQMPTQEHQQQSSTLTIGYAGEYKISEFRMFGIKVTILYSVSLQYYNLIYCCFTWLFAIAVPEKCWMWTVI